MNLVFIYGILLKGIINLASPTTSTKVLVLLIIN